MRTQHAICCICGEPDECERLPAVGAVCSGCFPLLALQTAIWSGKRSDWPDRSQPVYNWPPRPYVASQRHD